MKLACLGLGSPNYLELGFYVDYTQNKVSTRV
jgi:hypothetical protein